MLMPAVVPSLLQQAIDSVSLSELQHLSSSHASEMIEAVVVVGIYDVASLPPG